MVLVKNVNGAVSANTICHLRLTIYAQKKRSTSSAPPSVPNLQVFLLSGRGRLDVHINLLSAAAAKQSSSENNRQSQKDDYENHQDCDNSRAPATTTISIVSHETIPPPVL
jgi:hypothetical protein